MTTILLLTAAYAVLAAWANRAWAIDLPAAVLFGAVAYTAIHALRRRRILPFPFFLVAPAGLALLGAVQWATHGSVYRFPTAHAASDWAAGASCAWLAAQKRFSPAELHRVLTGIAIFAGTIAVLALLTALTSPFQVFWMVPVRFEQVFGPYVYRNHLAAFAELTLPIALYLAIHQPIRRAVFLVVVALLTAAVAVSASRTGLILLGVEFGAMAWIAVRSRWLPSTRAVGFLAAGLLAMLGGAAVVGISAVRARFAEEHPYRVRFEILQSTLEMARVRPWTGWGLGTFRTVYPEFGRFDSGVVVNEAHNDWAQWAAEGGVGAVLLMTGFAGWSLWMGLHNGWSLGIGAVLCHAWVDYPFEEFSLVLLVMLLAGCAWSARDGENTRVRRRNAPRHSRPRAPE